MAPEGAYGRVGKERIGEHPRVGSGVVTGLAQGERSESTGYGGNRAIVVVGRTEVRRDQVATVRLWLECQLKRWLWVERSLDQAADLPL